jgi:hypothetical protein
MTGGQGYQPRLGKLFCLLLVIAVPALGESATAPAEDLDRLLGAILGPSPLEENLRQLTDEIGGRVAGSESNHRAVAATGPRRLSSSGRISTPGISVRGLSTTAPM